MLLCVFVFVFNLESRDGIVNDTSLRQFQTRPILKALTLQKFVIAVHDVCFYYFAGIDFVYLT